MLKNPLCLIPLRMFLYGSVFGGVSSLMLMEVWSPSRVDIFSFAFIPKLAFSFLIGSIFGGFAGLLCGLATAFIVKNYSSETIKRIRVYAGLATRCLTTFIFMPAFATSFMFLLYGNVLDCIGNKPIVK